MDNQNTHYRKRKFKNSQDVRKFLMKLYYIKYQDLPNSMIQDIIEYNNVPLQRYMERGYFKIIRQQYKRGFVSHVYLKVLITPTGQHYLEELLINEEACNRS